MARTIDQVDRAIIECLQEDSRRASADIARSLGVAERTVRARIERLVADNVVRLVAIVNPAVVGYSVTADVFLEVDLGRVQEVADRVAEIDEVCYVGLTTGDRDISIQLYAPSVESLYDFVTDKLNQIPGVLRSKTYVIPRVVKCLPQWRLPSNLPGNPVRRSTSSAATRESQSERAAATC